MLKRFTQYTLLCNHFDKNGVDWRVVQLMHRIKMQQELCKMLYCEWWYFYIREICIYHFSFFYMKEQEQIILWMPKCPIVVIWFSSFKFPQKFVMRQTGLFLWLLHEDFSASFCFVLLSQMPGWLLYVLPHWYDFLKITQHVTSFHIMTVLSMESASVNDS